MGRIARSSSRLELKWRLAIWFNYSVDLDHDDRSLPCSIEMRDEIFTFESFINFVNLKKIFQDPLFDMFIKILYFNYNSPITRKNVSQV